MIARARAGEGPSFSTVQHVPLHGASRREISIASITARKQEEQEWKTSRDPIKLLTKWLTEQGHASTEELSGIAQEVAAEMKAAVEFAIASPYPAIDKVAQDVYA
jgi:TPP-dependent pyruvate/acetoin dehydrogenase alpha subunit